MLKKERAVAQNKSDPLTTMILFRSKKTETTLSDVCTDKKKHIARLNGVFAVFTVIKLLLIVFLNYWSVPVKYLLRLLNVNNINDALTSLASNEELPGLLTAIAIYLATVTIPTAAAFAIKKGVSNEDKAFYRKRSSVLETLCAVGTTFTVSYAVSAGFYVLFRFILNRFGYTFYPSMTEIPTSIPLILLYIVYICVCPAFSEEFLVRGFGMCTLKKSGNGFAVLMCAMCFMMMHSSVTNLPFSFFAGLCMGFFAIKFDSFWVAVITHFCLNLNSAIFQLSEPYLDTNGGMLFCTIYFIAVALFSLTFFLTNIFVYGIRLPTVEKPVFKKRWVFKCPFFYVFILVFTVNAFLSVIAMFE